MSTEQEDAVLLLELEEKITRRIRTQIRMMLDGYHPIPGLAAAEYTDPLLLPATLRAVMLDSVRNHILNDGQFIAELTKRIGQRMSQVY